MWLSTIIVAGGCNARNDSLKTVEILSEVSQIKMLPNLPCKMYNPTMVIHNQTILLSGGLKNPKTCFQLEKGSWIKHSTFSEARIASATVTTNRGTFIFGGSMNPDTFEYLLKDSTEWQEGMVLIPNGFIHGCAIAVKSGQEIWLIGGFETEKRILSEEAVTDVLSFQTPTKS